MWAVYVIQHNETKEIYFGVTSDLQRRLAEHNTEGQAATKRSSGSWKLIYTEIYRAKEDASLREQRLKNHGSGKHELLKRLQKSKLA